LLDLPVNRFINWLHLQAMRTLEWSSDTKAIEDLNSALEWPEVAEADDLERIDRNNRAAFAQLGIVLPDYGPSA
jgi:hypothetical protein